MMSCVCSVCYRCFFSLFFMLLLSGVIKSTLQLIYGRDASIQYSYGAGWRDIRDRDCP